MGHHYVPQRYLRNFQDPSRPGSLWLYDKQNIAVRPAAIKSVAQAKNYYTPEIESQLALQVEIPGNAVIEKLIAWQPITPGERFQLAFYIATMLKRVPRSRSRAKALFPGLLVETLEGYRAGFRALSEEGRYDPELIARRMSEIEAIFARYSTNPPQNVLDVAKVPWPSKELVGYIFSMNWHVYTTTGPQFFMTSDNPAFFFEGLGVNKADSELTFPLSSHFALNASWRGPPGAVLRSRLRQYGVREFNRRILSTTERLVFYHEDAYWLRQYLPRKPSWFSSIVSR